MADFDGVIFDMDGTLVVSPLDFVAIRAELGIAPGNGLLSWRPAAENRSGPWFSAKGI